MSTNDSDDTDSVIEICLSNRRFLVLSLCESNLCFLLDVSSLSPPYVDYFQLLTIYFTTLPINAKYHHLCFEKFDIFL